MSETGQHHWTPADDRELALRLMDGERPAVIAADLGTTKNAIIGRIHRSPMGLQQYVKQRAPAPKPKPKRRPVMAAPKPAPKPKALPKAPPSAPVVAPRRPAPLGPMRNVPLLDLKTHQCKWPVGEDRAVIGHFLFCARATAGAIYCAEHAARATGREYG